MTQLISTRGAHAAGGAAARVVAVATAAAVAVSLLGLSTPSRAEATSAPAVTQTRIVTWLSTDEQPGFAEAFEQDGLTYSLVGTEIEQLESQFGTVPAQRSVIVPCEPADLDAARNSFAQALDVDQDGYAGSIPLVQVAAALGIDISDENNISGKSATFSPEARFSTLQDLDAKRPTEIDMFSGTLIRMGKELSVETPFNEFAYHAIKALEEKNRGVIK